MNQMLEKLKLTGGRILVVMKEFPSLVEACHRVPHGCNKLRANFIRRATGHATLPLENIDNGWGAVEWAQTEAYYSVLKQFNLSAFLLRVAASALDGSLPVLVRMRWTILGAGLVHLPVPDPKLPSFDELYQTYFHNSEIPFDNLIESATEWCYNATAAEIQIAPPEFVQEFAIGTGVFDKSCAEHSESRGGRAADVVSKYLLQPPGSNMIH